jgi:sugar lactone lactonase YvrE
VTTLAGVLKVLGSLNGPAATATFNGPSGVALGPYGEVYVAEYNGHTIRRVRAGQVSTVAGIPRARGAVNGPAASATFNGPCALAVDSSGFTLFVAEYDSHTIRRIGGGMVTTLAGVRQVTGSLNGAAASATFNRPRGIVVDSRGSVYVADFHGHVIRKISGGLVSTLAGEAGVRGAANGAAAAATFSSPSGLAMDSFGNIYVADFISSIIRNISGGMVTTLAGGDPGYADGAATSASFQNPSGVAVDAAGNFFVTDAFRLVRKISFVG